MKKLLVVFLLVSSKVFCQLTGTVSASINLPTIALLDVEPAGAISLNIAAPNEAGTIVGNSATNSSKWINITSAVTTGLTRSVMAQISGTIPNGIRLRLVVASVVGGAGTRGTPFSPVFLTTTSQNIISGIGAAFTTSGAGVGFNLTYSLDIQSYSLLKSGIYSFSVVYTLVDN